MLSAIQIIRHAFSRVEIHCLPRSETKPLEENYEIQLGLSEPTFNETKNHWHLILDVRFGPGNETDVVRYKGHLCIEGVFRLHADFAPEKRMGYGSDEWWQYAFGCRARDGAHPHCPQCPWSHGTCDF